VKQDGNRAVLTAVLPVEFLHKALSGSATENSDSPAPPAQPPAKSR
jgi:hypothetical protein